MRLAIQAIILAIAVSAIGVSTLEYESSKAAEPFVSHNKLGPELQTSRQQTTGAPNFVRLVIMRLIYGLASSMGIEDRLEETFNGAFVPPSADDGFGLGGLGGDDEDDGGILGDVFGDDTLF